MARRRRVTLGRALALLLLGIALGASLFLLRHLRPDAIEQQFRDALEATLATDYKFDDILLDIDQGIEVIGLEISYPDGTLALRVERLGLTVSHQDLLAGEVNITQVDLRGLTLRLRPADGGGSGLPGVFKPPGEQRSRRTVARPPLIRVMPGAGGSRIEFVQVPYLKSGETVGLSIERFDGRPDGPLYTANARLSGPRTKRLDLGLRFDPRTNDLSIQARAASLAWTREDFNRLDPGVRRLLPPIEAGGVADVRLDAAFVLAPFKALRVEADIAVHDLHGAFGNIHTGEAQDLPFGLRAGQGEVHYRDGELWVRGFRGEYVSPRGEIGHWAVDFEADFTRVEPHIDFEIRGRDMTLSTDDMRNLLDPAVIEPVVNQFRPRGRMDFVFRMSQRPAFPTKHWLDVRLRDVDAIYAGHLDELTGQRYGFLYPLEHCRGQIIIENGIPTPRGPAERVHFPDLRGSNRIARPVAGGPDHVQVRVHGDILAYEQLADRPSEDFRLAIEIDDLPIDSKLARAFSAAPRGMPYAGFQLQGWAKTVRITVEQDALTDPEPRAAYDITLENCSMAYERFPLPIRGIYGRIVSTPVAAGADGLERRELELDLTGVSADGGRIRGIGTIDQAGERAQFKIDLQSPDLKAGPALRRALAEAPGVSAAITQLWDRLDPVGQVGVNVELRTDREPRVDLKFDGGCDLRGFHDRSLPITRLLGGIEYRGGIVTISDLRGEANAAPFRVSGTVREDGSFLLAGRIDQLYLQQPIRDLLREVVPDAARAIGALKLETRSALDVELRIERRGAESPIRTNARLARLDLVSRMKGLEISVRGGPIEVTPEAVLAKNLVLADGSAEVYVHEADLPRGARRRGWIELDARDLDSRRHLTRLFGEQAARVFGDNLRVDLTDFEIELHRGARNAVLRGRVDLRRHELQDNAPTALEPTGTLVLTPLTVRLPAKSDGQLRYHGIVKFSDLNLRLPVPVHDMSGELRIADGTFGPFTCNGAVFDAKVTAYERFFDKLKLNLTIDPEFVRLNNIDGALYEGRLRGDIDVHQRDPDGFRLRLSATAVQLAAMFEKDLPRDNRMTGLIDAELEIESRTGSPGDLKGQGRLLIRDAQLFKIPGIRSILAVLTPATPLRGPRFRRAEADFRIEGETIHVDRYHLSTKINDVKGKGTVSIYGDLDLVVEPQVTRLIDVTRMLDIPLLSVLRNLWHRAVYEIRVEGTLKSPDLRLRALPFLKRSRRRLTQSAHAGTVRRIRPRILPR